MSRDGDRVGRRDLRPLLDCPLQAKHRGEEAEALEEAKTNHAFLIDKNARGKTSSVASLSPARVVSCVRPGYGTIESVWLSMATMRAVLTVNVPPTSELHSSAGAALPPV